LQTDKLVDVQSWLVSASVADKERVKAMIDQAMKGLEEAGRIEVDQESGSAENSSTLNEIENKIQQYNF
jgi:TPP-dependent pyruvate/acetoin dehydrogenase alpha subunit